MNFTYNIHFEQMQNFDEIWDFRNTWILLKGEFLKT